MGAKKLKEKLYEGFEEEDALSHSNANLKEIDIDYLVSIKDPL